MKVVVLTIPYSICDNLFAISRFFLFHDLFVVIIIVIVYHFWDYVNDFWLLEANACFLITLNICLVDIWKK